MTALHPADDGSQEPLDLFEDDWFDADLPDGIEVVDEGASVVDLDTVRRRAAAPPTTLRPTSLPRRLPDGVVRRRIEPVPAQPPVFTSAARYRPIVYALVVAFAVFVAYGVAAVIPLLLPQGRERLVGGEAVVSERLVVGSVGSVEDAGLCDAIAGRLFVDSDANGVANPWDPPYDFEGHRIEVRTPDGFVRGATTAVDGTWTMTFRSAKASTLALARPDLLAIDGLWPGPRQLSDAGEHATLGATCSVDLGLSWIPEGGSPPALVDSPASVAPVGLGGDGGVQLHGRIWTDLDDNGVYDVNEPGRAAVELELRDSSGTVVATATSGSDGLYAIANLAPYERHSLRVLGDETPESLHFLGDQVQGWSGGPVVFDTGAADLSVWGADFAFAEGS